MSEQQNLRLVQQFYAAFQRGDIAGVLNAFADDVALFIPGPKEIIPCVGQRQGREQVAQFFATLAEMQDAEQFELRELIAQGNKVVGTKLASLELRELVRSLVQQIQIGEAQILVWLNRTAIVSSIMPDAPPKPTDSVEPFVLSITASLRRAGKGVRRVIGNAPMRSPGR
jgi:ketosteroid isomerase-like protein